MSRTILKSGVVVISLSGLTACEGGGTVDLRGLFNGGDQTGATVAAGETVQTTEREVEAPDVFSATEPGLWDGRPSLGGVWVAHPDVSEPERVIIRNTANDTFVVGALFRREREIPGPRLQISSDAAEALNVLAGAPVPLSVIALRKEVVEVPGEAPVETDLAAPSDVETAPLDPIATATAVLDAPETPIPAPAAPQSRLDKPFIQIGIFSGQANADRSATLMRSSGLTPVIKPGEKDGKPFWRVLVGPAQTASARSANLAKIREVGFTDAYAVTN